MKRPTIISPPSLNLDQIKTYFQDQVLGKVKEFWKEFEIQQKKQKQNIRQQEDDDVDVQVFYLKIEETSKGQVFKKISDRIIRCQKFKQPEVISLTKFFNDFQKIFDELQAKRKLIRIKINRALEIFCAQTFKQLEVINDELLRIEGHGRCGLSDVLRFFDEKVKNFNSYYFMWNQLPELQNEEAAENIIKVELNEKELKKFIGELVLKTYPKDTQVEVKQVEKIVPQNIYVDRFIEKVKTVEKEVIREKEDRMREAHEYLYGLTQQQNVKKALQLYEEEAKKQQIAAINVLGQLYYDGSLVDRDVLRAAQYYNQSAKAKNKEGLYWIGVILKKKLVEPKLLGFQFKTEDERLCQAIDYFQLASQMGSSDATTDLGKLYECGIKSIDDESKWLIPMDFIEAEKFYHNAALNNNLRGMVALGTLYKDHPDWEYQFAGDNTLQKAFSLFQQASASGYLLADYQIGLCYEQGLGTKQDLEQARRYFYHAAQKGDLMSIQKTIQLMIVDANQNPEEYLKLSNFLRQSLLLHNDQWMIHYNLGLLHEKGLGVNQDPSVALYHYKKAAQLGNLEAQLKVAYLYQKGESVLQDIDMALQYFAMASKQGSIDAKVRMGEIYFKGTPTLPKNPEKAYLLFHESAQQKNLDGIYNLAMLYQQGYHSEGGQSSTDQAVSLLIDAERGGHIPSKIALSQLGYQHNLDGSWRRVVSFEQSEEDQMFRSKYIMNSGILSSARKNKVGHLSQVPQPSKNNVPKQNKTFQGSSIIFRNAKYEKSYAISSSGDPSLEHTHHPSRISGLKTSTRFPL